MADKKGRIQAVIQKNLSEIILYQLKNPLVSYVSVNAVRMKDDYSSCKVYVSDINPERTEEIVRFLTNNSKKIRTMLSKMLDIYKTPELIFVADKSFEEEQRMKAIVDAANNRKCVTLADVFPEEKNDENEKKESADMKKPTNKKTTAKKESAVKKPATKKPTSKKSAK